MTAVVIVSSVPVVSLVGLAVTIAVAVLVAQWGAYRPQAKRIVTASLIALLCAPVFAAVVRAEDEFVMVNPCKGLTASEWEYWLRSCWLP